MSTRRKRDDKPEMEKLPPLERSKIGLGFVVLYFKRDIDKVQAMQLEEHVRKICEE